MKKTWFKKTGWLYRPVNFIGMSITLACHQFMWYSYAWQYSEMVIL